MKYCTKCGKELFDEAVICPGCGCSCETQVAPAEEDKKSFGWALLGFFVPVAGLVLYLIWKDKTPLKAKSCGKGALVSVIFGVIFYIAFTALSTFFFMNVSDELADESYLYESYEMYDDMYL